MSEADLIKSAWRTDPNFDILYYVVYGVAYALSIIPSIFGVTPILASKSFIVFYLIYDGLVRLFAISSKSADEPKIWNYTNWLVYSLRRYFVEVLANNVNVWTQLIPGLNWILNLIPLAISYINIFVL